MAAQYPLLCENLQSLIYEYRLSVADLARKVSLPIPTVHRLVTGKSKRPHQSSLEPLAKFFSLSTDQLVGKAPLPKLISNLIPSKISGKMHIPCYEWNDLKSATESASTEMSVLSENEYPENSFATHLSDSSMEPQFSKGNLLIFVPKKEIKDRGYVLVKLAETGTFLFRQILIDGDHKFLKPLNPDLNSFKMKLLSDSDQIIGVLAEARQVYSD